MQNVLVLINPRAGQKRANRMLCDIIQTIQEGDFHVEVYVTNAPGDATRYVQSFASRYDRVICIGGDGTLNEVIAGVVASSAEVPIGYIPAGSTNDYANTLGLSGDLLVAARDAISGQLVPLDVGSFNGRSFIYTASCGAFTRASYNTSQALKNTLGHAAYIFGGLADLSSMHPYHMRITAGDRAYEGDYLFCSVTNSTSVAGILKLRSEIVHLNDGEFEVMLVRNPENPIDLSEILHDIGTMELPSRMIQFFSAPEIVFDMDEPYDWTLDGEREPGANHIVLKNHRSAIRFVIPQEQVARLPGGGE